MKAKSKRAIKSGSIYFYTRLTIIFLILVLSLAGCGGGGGGGGGGDTGSGMDLSTGSVDFMASHNGPTPPAQLVQVSITADDAYYILAGYPPEATVASWLDIDLYESGDAWTLDLRVNNTAIAEGTYATTVRVLCARSDETVIAYRDVNVRFTISHHLSVSPLSLVFTHVNGASTAPANQSVRIDGSGIDWAVQADQDWVQLSHSNGTTPADLQIGVDPAGLSTGTHSAMVTVSDGEDSIDVDVTLEVQAPAFTPGITSLTFSGINGAVIGAQALPVQLNNGGGVVWTAMGSDAWLVLDKSSGSTPDVISVSVDPGAAALSSGSYAGSITLNGTFGGEILSAVIPVQLNLAAPSMEVNANSMTFNGINGATIAAQTLSLALDSGASTTWTATSSDVWLILDQSSGSTPDSISVSVDPGAATLSSGSYAGSITISGDYYGDPLSAVIPVQLNLTAPTLSLNQDSVILGGSDGLDLDPASLLQFSLPTGGNPFPWTATLDTESGISWMLADITSGTVSSSQASINLSAARSILTGGVYNGTVTINATVHGDSVVAAIPVVLNVEHHKLFVADNGVALSSMPTLGKLSHVVEVRDTYGLTTTNWSAVSDQPWLSVSANGLTGDGLLMTADPSGLIADTIHFATVSISSSDATVENTETVRIGLWVGLADPSATTSIAVSYKELVADPLRPYVYVHNQDTDISIYNVYTGALVTTITNVAPQLGPMVVSNDGAMLYASDLTNGQIVSLDLDFQTVGAAWDLATIPTYMRLTYARPNGVGVVLASDGRAYDATDGAQFDPGFQGSGNLAAGLDGNAFFVQKLGTGPHDLYRYDLDYTALDEQGLIIERTGVAWETGFGRDLAVSADGLRLYSACGSPYDFREYDGETLTLSQVLPADAYPNNVEVGANGLFYGGIFSWYGTEDVWVYDAAGFEQDTYYLSGYADEILHRQLAVSGDGLRIIVLTSDPTLQFVTGP